jgi:Probable molybdopterin binding domain
MTAILESGFMGVKFRRGQVITEEDIPALLDIGKSHVFVWEAEEDEVHEDDAARAVTVAICGEGIRYTGPSEGKMRINANRNGLFLVNSEALRRINSVEHFTVACRPSFTRVRVGEKLSGARIVPLVTKRENVEKAVRIAEEDFPVFSVKPFKALKSAVFITGSEVYYGRIKDSFEPIMRSKLDGYGAEILGVTKCPDDFDAVRRHQKLC